MNKIQLPPGYSKKKLKNVSVLITKNEEKDKSDLEINLTKSLKLKVIIVNLSQKYYQLTIFSNRQKNKELAT